ncbi:Membrane associated serine protease, rhomboid family [Chitinophaga sp. CF418]|nr:Membrane associated serine protease, rhomboid family [Chitinophaga sp. CF418]
MNGTSFSSDIRYWLRQGNTINHLLFWNIIVFLVMGTVYLIGRIAPTTGFLSTLLFDNLSLHANVYAFIRKPWGLLTYMFTHLEFLHILFNMLNLYWFGNIFRSFLGNQRVLPLYLLGGIMGGIAYLLVYNLAFGGVNAPMIGASASVMALLIACATKLPNYEIGLLFVGSIRLKWLALVVIILDLISLTQGNVGGIVAHMGGAVTGFIYIKFLNNGTDICQPLIWLFNRRLRVETPKRSFKPKKSPLKLVKPSQEENKQLRLDQLLDKINDNGMDSLSPEEKAWLKKMSQE